MQNLSEIEFKNEFVKDFPGDESGDIRPRQTPGVLYSKAPPTPVSDPRLLGWSEELAGMLEIAKPASGKDVDILAGNLVTPSMYPYAACYAGHQFGNWAGQLGDGRAITVGERVNSKGESWELQLKGAGITAYSRRGDGRAVLRSSVREFLMSEAMHYLGVPTTRALSLVSTGDQVMRDMFYDGRPAHEPGAIVMRAAPTFLRFGNFEMLAARQETDNLKQLAYWTIDRFYPHLKGEDRILLWLQELVDRTATMIVHWLRVGFVHGVMNTDNMSVLGLTIDYGPYSFLDDFDPEFTPNTTDLPGRRYAFGRQASIAYWNLGCLANALAPLISDTKELVKTIEGYQDSYWMKYYVMMAKKIGLDEIRSEDTSLFELLEKTLSSIKPDMTIFYQLLMELPEEVNSEEDTIKHFKDCFYDEPSKADSQDLFNLINSYRERIKTNKIGRNESLRLMSESNPRFILRNYLLHQAIEELERGQDTLFIKLQKAIKTPYSREHDEFFTKRPDWASGKAGCSMLSCSS